MINSYIYVIFLHALVFLSCSAALRDVHRSCCVRRANVFQGGTIGAGLVDSLGFPDVSTISLERIFGVSKLRENAKKTHV